MFATLQNAWKIPELRKKLIFTALILLLYRIGNVIPVPYIDVKLLTETFDQVLGDTILGLYNAMSGSAFSNATVLALSIQPYINASISSSCSPLPSPLWSVWLRKRARRVRRRAT